MWHGYIPALITPFRDNQLDAKAFQDLVAWQVDQGVHGVLVCGTTGEGPTLSDAEKIRMVELAVEAAAGKVPVMANTGTNNTAQSIELTKAAKKAGAEGALVVMPYYNKPTPEGQIAHFTAVADQGGLPVVIYNIPGRSVVNMSVETMASLAQHSQIIGVKDATGDLERPLVERLACGDDFILLSGEDATILPYLAQGGQGCISVTCNVAPKLCATLYESWQKGDLAKAQKINQELLPVHKAMFVETNPGPVKYAASLLGLAAADVRLPLVMPRAASQKAIQTALEKAGLTAKARKTA